MVRLKNLTCWIREVIGQVKCFPESRGLALILRSHTEKQKRKRSGIVVCTCNPRSGKIEIDRFLELLGHLP